MIKINHVRITALLMHLLFTVLLAQELTVSGTVRDANTHLEVSGVDVLIAGTDVGAVTTVGGTFVLTLAVEDSVTLVRFQHLVYDTLELTVKDILQDPNIYIQERVIPLEAVTVEADGKQLRVEQDLPQSVAVMDARDFEMRGYLDAGDLLRNEKSIQIDEALSGKKTLSLRGGNADDVVILFNGIRLNSIYDNTFDLSLIDLEDISRVEVVKGGNTALVAAEALSGVVNLVPKKEQDYTARFQQRFGTYASGNWGGHLYMDRNNLFANYSIKRGGSERVFSSGDGSLQNSTSHHNANVTYDFPESDERSLAGSVTANYLYSSSEYEDSRIAAPESVSDISQMGSIQFNGTLPWFGAVHMAGAYQDLDHDQEQVADTIHVLRRGTLDKAIHFQADKQWGNGVFDFVGGYQFHKGDLAYLDVVPDGFYTENTVILKSGTFQRNQHGFAAVAKFHAEPEGAINIADLDVSYRYDSVSDEPEAIEVYNDAAGDSLGVPQANQWQRGVLKFSAHIAGGSENYAFAAFMNVGTNVKYPSLFQQVSRADTAASLLSTPSLQPEEARNLEFGVESTWDTREHPWLYGIHLAGNYFRTNYSNKFRVYFTPGIPVASYDNVKTAQISGFEGLFTAYLLKKKLALDAGAVYYRISDLQAFPFKYTQKQTVGLSINHAGYSLRFFYFHEGKQVGRIRTGSPTNEFQLAEIELPAYENVDIHAGKFVDIKDLRLTLNLSVRNLLDDDLTLEGLALRDRRFYITFAAQY